MKLWCCGCDGHIDARLTDGSEAYPHRSDLHSLPFWKCIECGNFVGCHHKTKDRTRPLGCIPTPELKKARVHIHNLLDPLWQQVKRKQTKRKELYGLISTELGHQFHTANIRSIEEARVVYRFILALRREQ